MEENDIQSGKELIKKLRSKAELCRFAHSELKEKNRGWRNVKEFSVVLFSIISAGLIGGQYRGLWEGDWVLLLIFVLPLAIALIQAMDHTVFQWTQKITRHESAVAIWGNWIRESDFVEKQAHLYESKLATEKVHTIQEKYNYCMASTEQIPNSKFLKYKRKFRAYVLTSQEIDTLSLKGIEQKGWRKRRS